MGPQAWRQCRRVKGKRGYRELLKKRRGTNVIYTQQMVGLADEAGSDTILDLAGGEVVTRPLNRKA